MGAAIEHPAGLDPMADYLAAAMFAGGRQRVNGALEAVKEMRFTVLHHFDGFIVIVSAHFTFSHKTSLGGTYEWAKQIQTFKRMERDA
jgi:hypothetical protein